MTALLMLGIAGVIVVLLSLIVGDIFDGIFDVVGGDFLSMGTLGGFLGALGFGGAIILTLTDTWWLALVAGVLLGIGVGVLAWWLTMVLKRGESDATVRTGGLVGQTGRVIHAIPSGGYGAIRVRAAGAPTKLNAKAFEPIPGGALVEITKVLSPTSVEVRFGEPDDPEPVDPTTGFDPDHPRTDSD